MKSFLAALLLVALPLAAVPAVHAQTCSLVGSCGDLDRNGKVNTTDVLTLLKKAVGQNVTLQCQCEGSGDPNCEADLATCEADLATCLAGASCGDGILDDNEDCDIGQLAGETCESQGFEGGALGCSFCLFDTSDCFETRFVDDGPTILDVKNGLEWEKKTASDGVKNFSNARDADNDYSWCAGAGIACTAPGSPFDGTVASDFLARLNGAQGGECYAGHCDWRLPTLDELKSLSTEPCPSEACVADPLLLPMKDGYYWSSTTYLLNEAIAWLVNFDTGASSAGYKASKSYARAVRDAS